MYYGIPVVVRLDTSTSNVHITVFLECAGCSTLANRAAALFMKLLFGSVARVYVLRRGNSNRAGGFLLASNHISHFDPFIISSVVRRKIDWMAMAEFFPLPLLGFFLRAVDAFPAERNRADRKTIRTAIERLKHGRIVGLFPEGGIRDGARSVLEGAALRPGASTLAHIAGVPILPCVIVGSDRLYSKKRWLPLRRTPIWIAFGNPIPHFPDLEKSAARACIERELASAFKLLYAELREKFSLKPDDLPHPPKERMHEKSRPFINHEDHEGHKEKSIQKASVPLRALRVLRGEATGIGCVVLPRAVSICSCARRSICFSLVTICTRAVVRKWRTM